MLTEVTQPSNFGGECTSEHVLEQVQTLQVGQQAKLRTDRSAQHVAANVEVLQRVLLDALRIPEPLGDCSREEVAVDFKVDQLPDFGVRVGDCAGEGIEGQLDRSDVFEVRNIVRQGSRDVLSGCYSVIAHSVGSICERCLA